MMPLSPIIRPPSPGPLLNVQAFAGHWHLSALLQKHRPVDPQGAPTVEQLTPQLRSLSPLRLQAPSVVQRPLPQLPPSPGSHEKPVGLNPSVGHAAPVPGHFSGASQSPHWGRHT
jgi:hypothetical protein